MNHLINIEPNTKYNNELVEFCQNNNWSCSVYESKFIVNKDSEAFNKFNDEIIFNLAANINKIDIIKSQPGTGKSHFLTHLIKLLDEDDKTNDYNSRVFVMSSRQTLGNALFGFLETHGFVFYLNEKDRDLSKIDRLIISPESFVKRCISSKDRFDLPNILIIDECDAFFTHLAGQTMQSLRTPFLSCLEACFASTQIQVYCMDAGISIETLELIKRFTKSSPSKRISLLYNSFRPAHHGTVILNNDELAVRRIIEENVKTFYGAWVTHIDSSKLRNVEAQDLHFKKQMILFFGSKKKMADWIDCFSKQYPSISRYGLESLILKIFDGATDKSLSSVKNPDINWRCFPIICHTTKMVFGVNYSMRKGLSKEEQDEYDVRIYGLPNDHITAEMAFQMGNRCRFKSLLMIYCPPDSNVILPSTTLEIETALLNNPSAFYSEAQNNNIDCVFNFTTISTDSSRIISVLPKFVSDNAASWIFIYWLCQKHKSHNSFHNQIIKCLADYSLDYQQIIETNPRLIQTQQPLSKIRTRKNAVNNIIGNKRSDILEDINLIYCVKKINENYLVEEYNSSIEEIIIKCGGSTKISRSQQTEQEIQIYEILLFLKRLGIYHLPKKNSFYYLGRLKELVSQLMHWFKDCYDVYKGLTTGSRSFKKSKINEWLRGEINIIDAEAVSFCNAYFLEVLQEIIPDSVIEEEIDNEVFYKLKSGCFSKDIFSADIEKIYNPSDYKLDTSVLIKNPLCLSVPLTEPLKLAVPLVGKRLRLPNFKEIPTIDEYLEGSFEWSRSSKTWAIWYISDVCKYAGIFYPVKKTEFKALDSKKVRKSFSKCDPVDITASLRCIISSIQIIKSMKDVYESLEGRQNSIVPFKQMTTGFFDPCNFLSLYDYRNPIASYTGSAQEKDDAFVFGTTETDIISTEIAIVPLPIIPTLPTLPILNLGLSLPCYNEDSNPAFDIEFSRQLALDPGQINRDFIRRANIEKQNKRRSIGPVVKKTKKRTRLPDSDDPKNAPQRKILKEFVQPERTIQSLQFDD